MLKIFLVADKNYRQFGVSHLINNFFIQSLHNLEALNAVNAVDEDVSMHVHTVLGGEDAVLVLPGCVDQGELELLILDSDCLVKCVLNCRVIGVYELALERKLLQMFNYEESTVT